MSGVSGPPGIYGVLTRILDDSAQARRHLDALTVQAASGRVSDTYAGLGAGAALSLDLRPQIGAAQGWQVVIDRAGTRLDATQSVLTQLNGIATSMIATLDEPGVQEPAQIGALAADARAALQTVAGTLNVQIGGEYILSGEDSANSPVPGGGDRILSGAFFGAIKAAVAGLATDGPAATIAATLAAASAPANTPYAAAIGSGPPVMSVGPGEAVPVGIVAGRNAAAVMNGSSTTGSYVTDLMRVLATIGSLDSAAGASATGIRGVLDDARATLQGAVAGMTTDAAYLGSSADALGAIRTRHADTVTALTRQVSSVEDVDMAATASRITQTQAQLEASYRLIAGMQSLSLASLLKF